MCMYYSDVQSGADVEAIADRLRGELHVQLEALPAAMAELLMKLDGQEAAHAQK